jgi:hypothetical protein
LWLSAAVAAGCSSGTRPNPEGNTAFPCQPSICTPDPNGVCQHTCTPDPGPRLVQCRVPEQNFEFSSLWTFDEASPMGRARAMYSYTDNTNSIATFNKNGRQTYQPPTAVMPRCSDVPNPMNRTIHIQGGPFLGWGGGVGMSVKDFKGITMPASYTDVMMDVSEWEGISFWARRGPDSQVGFRVLVGDKYTDDDIAYLMYKQDPTMPRFCERVRECACLNHRACTPLAVSIDNRGLVTSPADFPPPCLPQHAPNDTTISLEFCGTPELLSAGGMGSGAGSATQCNTCERTRCDEVYPAYPDDQADPSAPAGTDRQFYGKKCTPYTMRNGIHSSWCFDPATERPAEPTEQCGDHWTNVVNLSNEWQFYTVPFSSMLQQGWAKRSPKLDLTAVSVFRFTWDGGWVDYWLDDVALYRHKPMPPPQGSM